MYVTYENVYRLIISGERKGLVFVAALLHSLSQAYKQTVLSYMSHLFKESDTVQKT